MLANVAKATVNDHVSFCFREDKLNSQDQKESMGIDYDAKQFFGVVLDEKQVAAIYRGRHKFLLFKTKQVIHDTVVELPLEIVDLIGSYLFSVKKKTKKTKETKETKEEKKTRKRKRKLSSDKETCVKEEYFSRKDFSRMTEVLDETSERGWFSPLEYSSSSPYYDCSANEYVHYLCFPLPEDTTAGSLLRWLKELDMQPLKEFESFFKFKFDEPSLKCVPNIFKEGEP